MGKLHHTSFKALQKDFRVRHMCVGATVYASPFTVFSSCEHNIAPVYGHRSNKKIHRSQSLYTVCLGTHYRTREPSFPVQHTLTQPPTGLTLPAEIRSGAPAGDWQVYILTGGSPQRSYLYPDIPDARSLRTAA